MTAADVVLVRLEALRRAITARDWDGTEFQYDRVLSAALRLNGTRTRPYDPPAHVGSTSHNHGDRCHCGRPARWHVAYGSGCGNVCTTHKRAIARAKNGHVTVSALGEKEPS